ncbi:hypothetical protein Bca52824_002908 [Brassica carinata]|uniref:Uncharacterized protein n=1 Tax=Brassica carinata TaxID=52824 RepID=A0A8X7WIR3_BRACI|nr:hypothetical protein Bca52824_002908 [Brassica carinata]
MCLAKPHTIKDKRANKTLAHIKTKRPNRRPDIQKLVAFSRQDQTRRGSKPGTSSSTWTIARRSMNTGQDEESPSSSGSRKETRQSSAFSEDEPKR